MVGKAVGWRGVVLWGGSPRSERGNGSPGIGSAVDRKAWVLGAYSYHICLAFICGFVWFARHRCTVVGYRGFGTVRFTTKEDAATACDKLNNSQIDGRTISVRLDRFA